MKNQIKSKLVLLLLNVVVVVFTVAIFGHVLFLQGPSRVLGNGAKKSLVTSALPAIKTVFLIMMENENWSAILGSASAPYINNTLLPMASYANQYYTPPNNHPSLPNYLWLEAGTNFGITKDGDPSIYHQGTTNHLTTLLSNAGYSWKAYLEGITGSTCPLKSVGLYTPHHNGTVYFDDVTGVNNPNSAYCIAHERPFTQLATDLQNNTLANYNYIVPNQCDDMHNSKCGTQNAIQNGDTWLSMNVPQILNSQAYQSGGVLFITWDEGKMASDGPIGMIVLSPFAKGHGYSNSIHYTHSSTLLTIEETFSLTPLLGDAANATDLSDLFGPSMLTPTPSPTPTPTPTPGAIISQDTFQRPNQTEWGLASDGINTWGADASTNAVFSITNNTGQVKNGTTTYSAILGAAATNAQVLFIGSMSSFSNANLGAVLRWTSGNNWYKAYIDGVNLVLQKRVNGSYATLRTAPFTATANTNYSLRFQIVGTTLSAKAWPTSGTEPANWMVTASDSSFSSGYCGLRMLVQSGVVATITSFQATAL